MKGKAKDHLCSLWAEKRSKELEEIIIRCGYVASAPELLSALTIFLNGKRPEIAFSEDTLNRCLTDTNKRIAKNTFSYLIENDNYDYLWEFAKGHPDSFVPVALKGCGWYPKKPEEQALFFFLADDLDADFDIDFDQSMLRVWYETGTDRLKKAIASKIRRSGDARLLAIFRTKSGARKTYHKHEIDLEIELLTKNKRYEDLFKLIRYATYNQAVKIIKVLKTAGWSPADTYSQKLYKKLLNLKDERYSSYAYSIYEDFRPMFLVKKLPKDEATLIRWAEDKNFRKRSTAVILLAEKNSNRLSDVANKLAGDAYWQVRLAVACAELLKTQHIKPDE